MYLISWKPRLTTEMSILLILSYLSLLFLINKGLTLETIFGYTDECFQSAPDVK